MWERDSRRPRCVQASGTSKRGPPLRLCGVWCVETKGQSIGKQGGAQSRSRMTTSSPPRTTAGTTATEGGARPSRDDTTGGPRLSRVVWEALVCRSKALRCAPVASERPLVNRIPQIPCRRKKASRLLERVPCWRSSSWLAWRRPRRQWPGAPQSQATAPVRDRSSVPVDRGSTCRRASLRIDRSHKAKRAPQSTINHLFPQPAELL